MEVTKYLCEFFFTNFWHWLGLVIFVAAIRGSRFNIGNSYHVDGNNVKKEEKAEE